MALRLNLRVFGHQSNCEKKVSVGNPVDRSLLAVFSLSRQAEIGQKLLFVNGLSPKSAATGVRIASEATDRRAWLSSKAAFTASLATWLEVTDE
jgi:hypothetical protein